jgi:hypothetical protein
LVFGCFVQVCLIGAVAGGCKNDDGSQASGSGSNGEGSDDGISVGDQKFDVGGGSATGAGDDPQDAGCKKVDFLFVIDSSNSMATNQAELIASFPEFVDSIYGSLDQVDSYHVGVVTSDAYEWNESGCQSIGALVTQTGGKDSGMQTCGPFASGARFMSNEDDLDEAFACTALIGTGGDNDEAMMEGALQAVSSELNEPGACNDGFIRQDALLVLVLITDEDDPGTCINGGQSCDGSPGDPDEWFDFIVDVKGGHAENIVALSLTRGAPDNSCGSEQGTETDGERIMSFVNRFGNTGLTGDICASSFGAFFDRAVGLISSACGGFIPPVG